MNIVALKLLNGEDVLCDLIYEDANHFEVESPANIVSQPTVDGRGMSLGLAPYLPFAASKKVKIVKSSIITMYEPDQKLSNEYNRIFGSGIVIAGAGDIPR